MNAELKAKIRSVEPYVPGEQPTHRVIKLNTNENPYAPAPGVEQALRGIQAAKLRLYPDPTSSRLVNELAGYYGIRKDQVFVGVGSDDVLAMSFLTFFSSGRPILFPDITYSFYKVWAELYRIPYECPKLDERFHLVKEDYYKENGGVIFPNPNAPTSVYEEPDVVEDIVAHNRSSVVIVDEAYIDFARESALKLIGKYENLLVVQTYSKSRSMAGMRIGYAMGNAELIKCLNDAKYAFNSYTMNQPSLICGTEALKDRAYFEDCIRKIKETREWAKEEFRKLGFSFPDAQGNFIFVAHPDCEGEKLFQALKEQDIYVRHFKGERVRDYLRVTVGTRKEMETLFAFLKEYLGRGHTECSEQKPE